MDGWEDPASRRLRELMRQVEEQERILRPLREAEEYYRHVDEAARVTRMIHDAWTTGERRDFDSLLSVQTAIDRIGGLELGVLAGEVERQSQRVAEWERILRLSVQPYPHLGVLAHSQTDHFFLDAYSRLNAGLVASGLLAEVELDIPDGEELQNAEGESSEAERQLIEVVPAEALDALRRIQFVPFSLLAAATAKPEVLFEITPRTFEQFIAELVSRLGIDNVVLTPERADGGRDVIGTKLVLGIPLILAFECKRYAADNPVPVETARALLGTVTHGDYRADRGILVTTSRFTEPARRFIVTSPVLEGRDFTGIVDWLSELADGRPARE